MSESDPEGADPKGADPERTDPDGADLDPAEQRRAVRERYGGIASADADDCCGPSDDAAGCSDSAGTDARALGYTEDDLEAVASGADLSLGCGNPQAIAALEPGEVVLDLGSGGGFDCFLAAREVGDEGRVVGVDMTPEMVETARANADANDVSNVEFRLGEIEHLPVADASVDVIISNCVINLSPDKPQVFREAHRVLRPGGRLAVSDVVLTAEPPAGLRADPESVAACVAGASSVPALESMLEAAGFEGIEIEPNEESAEFISEWDDGLDPSEFVASARIEARKPGR
jgi:SAM-dependent methyltransferase